MVGSWAGHAGLGAIDRVRLEWMRAKDLLLLSKICQRHVRVNTKEGIDIAGLHCPILSTWGIGRKSHSAQAEYQTKYGPNFWLIASVALLIGN